MEKTVQPSTPGTPIDGTLDRLTVATSGDDLILTESTHDITVVNTPEDVEVLAAYEAVEVVSPPQSPARRPSNTVAPLTVAALAAFAVAWRLGTRRQAAAPAPAGTPAPTPPPPVPAVQPVLHESAQRPEAPVPTGLPQVQPSTGAQQPDLASGLSRGGGSTALTVVEGGDPKSTSKPGLNVSRFVEQVRTGETKEFFKTSEFLFVLLAVVVLVVAAAAQGTFDAPQMWRLVTVLLVAYVLSRGLAKAGSRRDEPSGRQEG